MQSNSNGAARIPVKVSHEFAVIKGDDPAGTPRKVAQRSLGDDEAMQVLGLFAHTHPEEMLRNIKAQEQRRRSNG